MKGVPTQPKRDRDEYPPAMFGKGGEEADIRSIPRSDNRGSGSSVGQQLKPYPDGTKVKFKIGE